MILNSLAREITGHPTINQGISLTNLFNEDLIDKIAESGWGRFWTIFTSFGTTTQIIWMVSPSTRRLLGFGH